MEANFGLDMLVTAVVLAGAFYLFMREQLPPHITALAAMAILLATGVITTGDALSVFSNPAPVTIACMFVLSAALERTGVIDAMGYYMLKAAERNRIVVVIVLLGGVMLLSAFVNNTPIVIVMAPIVIAVARKLSDYPSRYLIPLSYAAILGGTCTLIGTSTNLLVDGVARTMGQQPFGLFEITLPALCLALVGLVYMATIGRKLLPERPMLEQELIGGRDRKRFYAEAVIPFGSPLIGQTLNELKFTDKAAYEIIDLVRHDQGRRGLLSRFTELLEGEPDQAATASRVSALRDLPLQAGDRLLFKTHKDELLELRHFIGINFDTEDMPLANPMGTRETLVTEGIIGPGSTMIGKRPSQLRLRRRYGCYILAIHRGQQNLTGNLDQIVLRDGDVLLVEGPRDELERLFGHEELLSLSQLRRRSFNRTKAPLAIATLAGVVVLAALDVMPIAGLAIIGAMIVLLSGCVSYQDAFAAIEWRILLLICGALALSIALGSSGLARFIVEALADLVRGMGPVAVLAMLYLVTSLLTEAMSNNATAVLLTPIAIGLADTMGVDARPFLVAVMFAASASFATPIGYQTNTYVYNAGNYRFRDFVKIGLPLNVLMLMMATIVIPMFWSF